MLDPCPEPAMGAVAREVNLSETTFPTVVSEGEYHVRIFTPDDELPFAGHPSLGTAWALGPRRWTQVSPGGTVTIDADEAGAEMSQPDPELSPVDAAAAVAALGLRGAEGAWLAVVAGMTHVLVATASSLDALTPDLEAVARVAADAGGRSLAPFRRVDDHTLHVRVFLPGSGIPEDPGTGSAAGAIGLVAADQWGTSPDVTIRQGDEMGRPSRIAVHAERGAIRVGGRVTLVAEGDFLL